MECINCKIEISQTKGKRPKIYCSDRCKVDFFRSKKATGGPKRGRGRPRKAPIVQPPHERDSILINADRGRDSNGMNMEEVKLAKKEAKKEKENLPKISELPVVIPSKESIDSTDGQLGEYLNQNDFYMGYEIPKGLKGIDLTIWKSDFKEKQSK